MTKIIISLLISLVIGCGESQAQHTGKPYSTSDSTQWIPRHDTIPCIMLVCDTSYSQPDHYDHGWPGALYDDKHLLNCWVMYGYMTMDYTVFEVKYLDGDKKPVQLFVWMSQPFKN